MGGCALTQLRNHGGPSARAHRLGQDFTPWQARTAGGESCKGVRALPSAGDCEGPAGSCRGCPGGWCWGARGGDGESKQTVAPAAEGRGGGETKQGGTLQTDEDQAGGRAGLPAAGTASGTDGPAGIKATAGESVRGDPPCDTNQRGGLADARSDGVGCEAANHREGGLPGGKGMRFPGTQKEPNLHVTMSLQN